MEQDSQHQYCCEFFLKAKNPLIENLNRDEDAEGGDKEEREAIVQEEYQEDEEEPPRQRRRRSPSQAPTRRQRAGTVLYCILLQ